LKSLEVDDDDDVDVDEDVNVDEDAGFFNFLFFVFFASLYFWEKWCFDELNGREKNHLFKD
jgi:hypothetical protein